jgi:hypothetical protein
MKFFLMKYVLIRHCIEERILNKIIELRLVVQLSLFGNSERRFPVPDLFVRLPAVVPYQAVGYEKLTCNSFSFVGK